MRPTSSIDFTPKHVETKATQTTKLNKQPHSQSKNGIKDKTESKSKKADLKWHLHYQLISYRHICKPKP